MATEIKAPSEIPSHYSVKELSQKHNAIFLHGIYTGSRSDNSLLHHDVPWTDKILINLCFNPTISTHTLSPDAFHWDTYSHFGLVLSDGQVVKAHGKDAATRALSLHTRESEYPDIKDDFHKVVNLQDPNISHTLKHYNEVVIRDPTFSGLYYSQKDYPKVHQTQVENFAKLHGLTFFLLEGAQLKQVSETRIPDSNMLQEQKSRLLSPSIFKVDSLIEHKLKQNPETISDLEFCADFHQGTIHYHDKNTSYIFLTGRGGIRTRSITPKDIEKALVGNEKYLPQVNYFIHGYLSAAQKAQDLNTINSFQSYFNDSEVQEMDRVLSSRIDPSFKFVLLESDLT